MVVGIGLDQCPPPPMDTTQGGVAEQRRAYRPTHLLNSTPASTSYMITLPSYPADMTRRGSWGCASSTCAWARKGVDLFVPQQGLGGPMLRFHELQYVRLGRAGVYPCGPV